ncbi:MAG: phenylpyruvate tautomerase MIF-related protein [Erysipelotrichaceae bacterium]
MPFIEIKTNIDVSDKSVSLIEKVLGKDIEILPGKSEKWLMINIIDNQKMCFGGSNEPCVIALVDLYGKCDDKFLNSFTLKLTDLLSSELNVLKERIYVRYQFTDYWGYAGDNF